MHPNPIYRQTPRDKNLAFARSRGFGLLSINGPSAPMVSHIPFRISDTGDIAELHLVRSNPIARALATGQPALIAVSGPDSYVSPDWYGAQDQVPTWNYVAVHLFGQLELLPQTDLPALLDRLSANFENRLAPKVPWTSGKMSTDVRDRMMRQIVPARLVIGDIQGTWKLNQNKPDDVRLAAAAGLENDGIGQETAALATLMRRL